MRCTLANAGGQEVTLVKIVPVLAGALALITVAADASDVAPAAHVAFVVSEGFNVMDFAGPWEVFQDVQATAASDHDPYQLYTVAASTQPVKTAGGATVTPSYRFADAPKPDIIVIGAQSDNSAALLAWLREQHAGGATIMSVCTGARKLALAGLLDGKRATSHHEYLASFAEQFPKVDWQSSRRYVKADAGIYTAGGLTSGIDLALHLVAERFGTKVAEATARYMEYQGRGWLESE
jgi:transcriptional regulator GlxA family with amidase domain